MPDTIRAAGGVVWRVSDGTLEIALVHRPRYDDWSLPKGKLDADESELAAAVREVREELGSDVVVSRRLTTIGYAVGAGRKTVAFWVMRHRGGDFVPSDEVDEVVWLPPTAASEKLTYRDEQAVLAEFAQLPVPDSVVVLVRHAKAGKRSEWTGDDAERPLDSGGVEQSERLVGFLSPFRADRVVSASPVRCVQTVQPFAASAGLEVMIDPAFSDDDYVATPAASEAALLALARPGRVSVVASQGTTIPALVETFAPWAGPGTTRKSAAWVLSAVDGEIVAADYYPEAGRE